METGNDPPLFACTGRLARFVQWFCHYVPRGGGMLAARLWRLFTQAGYIPNLTWHGFPMYLNFENGDHLSYWLGRYERGTVQVLRRELTEGAMFIDVGANAGFYTIMAALAVGPKGRVLAFEPEPTIAGWLRKNVHMNHLHNVEIRQVALADRVGKALLASRPDSGNSMLLARKTGTATGSTPTIEVGVSTLDEECAGFVKNSLAKVILKMDIEGAEPLALAGGKSVLAHTDTVIVEMRPNLLKEMHLFPKDLVTPLLDNGFTGYAIPDREGPLREIHKDFVGVGNLLFKRSRPREPE